MRKEYREDMTWRANYRDKMKEARHFPSSLRSSDTRRERNTWSREIGGEERSSHYIPFPRYLSREVGDKKREGSERKGCERDLSAGEITDEEKGIQVFLRDVSQPFRKDPIINLPNSLIILSYFVWLGEFMTFGISVRDAPINDRMRELYELRTTPINCLSFY